MIDTIIRLGVYGAVLLVALILTVGLVAFLAGLGSAAWEIRQERAAGLPVTRPAWDQRRKRKAVGRFASVRVMWTQARHGSKVDICWCTCGPVQWFSGYGDAPETRAGYGCAAWESGDPIAFARHSKAGGYGRTTDRSVFRRLASDA